MINRKGIGSYLSVLLVARALLEGPITESWAGAKAKVAGTVDGTTIQVTAVSSAG